MSFFQRTASFFKSTMASEKDDQYGRLMHDDDSETSEKDLPPRFQRKPSYVSCLLISNILLALVVVALSARSFYRPSASTPALPYTGVSTNQLLQDQLGVHSSVVQTYRFFEENLDDMDFSKGDPYWEALFPSKTDQTWQELWIID